MPDVNRSRYCSCCKTAKREQVNPAGEMEWHAAVCPNCDTEPWTGTITVPQEGDYA